MPHYPLRLAKGGTTESGGVVVHVVALRQELPPGVPHRTPSWEEGDGNAELPPGMLCRIPSLGQGMEMQNYPPACCAVSLPLGQGMELLSPYKQNIKIIPNPASNIAAAVNGQKNFLTIAFARS